MAGSAAAQMGKAVRVVASEAVEVVVVAARVGGGWAVAALVAAQRVAGLLEVDVQAVGGSLEGVGRVEKREAAMAMVDAELVVAVAKVVQRVQVCTVEADLVAVTMVVVALEEAATVMAAVELVAAAVEEVKMAEA